MSLSIRERDAIEDRAGNIVVSGNWIHSRHWERNEYGRLTPAGWRRALRDAEACLAHAEWRARNLNSIVRDIRKAVAEIDAQEAALAQEETR